MVRMLPCYLYKINRAYVLNNLFAPIKSYHDLLCLCLSQVCSSYIIMLFTQNLLGLPHVFNNSRTPCVKNYHGVCTELSCRWCIYYHDISVKLPPCLYLSYWILCAYITMLFAQKLSSVYFSTTFLRGQNFSQCLYTSYHTCGVYVILLFTHKVQHFFPRLESYRGVCKQVIRYVVRYYHAIYS